MNTLKCCVIDDEPLACQLIASYIEKTPYLRLIKTFSSAQESIKYILNGDIDLVFLDIEMPQLNGLEFAKIIPPTCKIIFTTAYDKYALQGFRVNALDYLMKPISYDEFLNASYKALKQIHTNKELYNNNNRQNFIIVKSEYKLIQIATDDILFIEGVKDYVKIYLDNEPKSIMTLMSMKIFEHNLPSNIFIRVHRSYIVNTTKIKVIERNRIVFGKHYIPVSETYKQAFNNYITSQTLSPINETEYQDF